MAPSLLLPFAWALLRCYRRELRIGALFHLGFAASQLLLPFLIGFFLNYLETGLGGTYAGVGIALLLGAVSISSSYCITSTTYWMRRLALNMRGAVMMRIYEHALQLSPPSRRSTPPAQIMNLMSVDADKLFLSAHYLHALWHGPLAIVIVLILLSLEIGVISAVCGMAVLIAMIPVQHYLAHSIKDCRTSMSRDTDGRVRLTNEVIQVIRAVKYYAWEQSMVDRIVIARNIEVAGNTSCCTVNLV